jgi:uroporphyrin-III C-methyltransferase/precorrin-2 dehydrogenase/sirohydrochlorin ferrochelatase
VLGRLLRARLEALLPARLGRLARLARALRPQVAARLPASRRRAFWEAVLQGPIAESVFAGREQQAREAMLAHLDGGAAAAAGEVYLVPLPPHGDPEQLTLRALRLLQQADVVFVDDGLPPPLSDLIRRDAERRIAAADPAGVIEQITALAQTGRRVGWLSAAHGEARQRLQQRGVSVMQA